MMLMRVERQEQGWAFLHDSYSRVATSVNLALVPLGNPEPAFEFQIVPRQVRSPFASKKSHLKTRHHFTHVLKYGVVLEFEVATELGVSTLALHAWSRGWVECVVDRANLVRVRANLSLRRLDKRHSSVDAARQLVEQPFRGSPFLRRMFRFSDRRTSRRASDIRSPGG